MIRGLVKAAASWCIAQAPLGPERYHELTRRWLGSQGVVVQKLQKSWPGYVGAWANLCQFSLERGDRVWVYDAGVVPFGMVAAYLLTGHGGVLSSSDATAPLGRYVADAVRAACVAFPEAVAARQSLDPKGFRALESARSLAELIAATGGVVLQHGRGVSIPLGDQSVRLCHSNGALEHHTPRALDVFIQECLRVLRPGGLASHIFDHRDHLRHFDRSWPFLAHMALPNGLYRAAFDHPLLYHNRLTAAEVEARFASAGFVKVASRRFILPQYHYVVSDEEVMEGERGVRWRVPGTPSWRLGEQEVRTAATHLLYRKPG